MFLAYPFPKQFKVRSPSASAFFHYNVWFETHCDIMLSYESDFVAYYLDNSP